MSAVYGLDYLYLPVESRRMRCNCNADGVMVFFNRNDEGKITRFTVVCEEHTLIEAAWL